MGCNQVDADIRSKLPWVARLNRPLAPLMLVAIAAWLSLGPSAQAVIVVQDMFDDADRDNDGFTDDGNNTAVTTPDGIKWFSADGTFIGGTNPGFSIVDDSGPEGFNTGNALDLDRLQAGPDVTGFFGQTISLGPNVGDKLVMSFDWRTTSPLLAPFDNANTTMRFGLWQDTDNQIGMTSLDRDGISVTTWGETDGYFQGATDCATTQPVGGCGDYGVWSRIKIASNGAYAGNLTANLYFIDEEINADIAPGGNDGADVIIQLNDASTDPDPSTIPVPKQMPSTISLTLERVVPLAEGAPDIRYDVAIDGVSFGAQPATQGNVVPADSDSFDYFWIVPYADVDQRIDNFKIELIEGGLSGDHNKDGKVDAADYVAWRDNPVAFGDQQGYDDWRANFGAPGVGEGNGSSAVPEPTSLYGALCAALGVLATGTARSRRRHAVRLHCDAQNGVV